MSAHSATALTLIFLDLETVPVAIEARQVQALLMAWPVPGAADGVRLETPPRLETLLGFAEVSSAGLGSGAAAAVARVDAGSTKTTPASHPDVRARSGRRLLLLRDPPDTRLQVIDVPAPTGPFAVPVDQIYPLPPLLAIRQQLPGLRALIAGTLGDWRLVLDPQRWVSRAGD